MHKTPIIAMFLALVVVDPRPAAAQQCDGNHTLRLDAVELVGGKEVQGRDDIALTHQRFAYHFASEANRKEFQAHPDRYEIQLGGACGSMGPLSGDGTTSIWAVHDGRIYIFASVNCRNRFLAAPEKMLDHDDAPPPTTPASLSRGRELLVLAVQAIGGAERLDAVKTYAERMTCDTKSGQQDYHVIRSLTLGLPHGLRTYECWNDSCWSDTLADTGGWRESKAGLTPLHPQQNAALGRAHGRHPLMLLRARNEDGLVATGEGHRETIAVPQDGEVEVELVTIAYRGVNTTLGIEPTKGRIRLVRFIGRGLGSSIGDTQKVFADFKDIGGLALPSRVHITLNGKPQPDYSGAFDLQELDRPEHLDLFKCPLHHTP